MCVCVKSFKIRWLTLLTLNISKLSPAVVCCFFFISLPNMNHQSIFPSFHPFLSHFPQRFWYFSPFSQVFPRFFPHFPSLPRPSPVPFGLLRKALNALAEGTAALRRLAQFLALEEAPAPRPPMSEDRELPLLLAPGDAVVETTQTRWIFDIFGNLDRVQKHESFFGDILF